MSCVDDDAIRILVKRLARAHPSGGTVIERAAIVAAGTGSNDVLAWITAHGGEAEAVVKSTANHGLHGSRLHDSVGSPPPPPSRFVLPVGALDKPD